MGQKRLGAFGELIWSQDLPQRPALWCAQQVWGKGLLHSLGDIGVVELSDKMLQKWWPHSPERVSVHTQAGGSHILMVWGCDVVIGRDLELANRATCSHSSLWSSLKARS